MAKVHSPVADGPAEAPVCSNPLADRCTDSDTTGKAVENKPTAAARSAPAGFVSICIITIIIIIIIIIILPVIWLRTSTDCKEEVGNSWDIVNTHFGSQNVSRDARHVTAKQRLDIRSCRYRSMPKPFRWTFKKVLWKVTVTHSESHTTRAQRICLEAEDK